MFVMALNGKVSTTVLLRLENQLASGQFVINDLIGDQDAPFLSNPFVQRACGPKDVDSHVDRFIDKF